jgi:hypothetical protein
VARTVDAYLAPIEAEPQVYRFLVHSDEAAGADSSCARSRAGVGAAGEGIGAENSLDGSSVRAQTWAHAIVGMVQAAGDWWLEQRPCPRAELVEELVVLLAGGYDLPSLSRLTAPAAPSRERAGGVSQGTRDAEVRSGAGRLVSGAPTG